MPSCSTKSFHPRGKNRCSTVGAVAALADINEENVPGGTTNPSPAIGRHSAPTSRFLAADLRHRARCADEAGLVDAVLELLVLHGPAEDSLELLVGGAVAERRLEIPLAAREEARPELAVRGQAEAIAGGAERLGDRVDEPDLARSVGEAEATGGRRGLRGDLVERPVLLDQRADLCPGED